MHTQHLLQTEAMNRLVASMLDLDRRIKGLEEGTGGRVADIPTPVGGTVTPLISPRPLTPLTPMMTPTEVVTPGTTQRMGDRTPNVLEQLRARSANAQTRAGTACMPFRSARLRA